MLDASLDTDKDVLRQRNTRVMGVADMADDRISSDIDDADDRYSRSATHSHVDNDRLW